jgi:hypothetical protein
MPRTRLPFVETGFLQPRKGFRRGSGVAVGGMASLSGIGLMIF